MSRNETVLNPPRRPGVTRFADALPTDCKWFVFIDPEDTDRWIVGWPDIYHVRVEGGPSYSYKDPLLTWWHPLPQIPSLQLRK